MPVSTHESRAMSLLFRVRRHLCALPLAHVVETMRPLPVETMSGAVSGVRGIAIIRGEPVPVVDIAGLFRDGPESSTTEPGPEPSARFVTVRIAGRTIALAVDSILGIRALALDSLGDLPPLLRDAGSDLVDSIGTLDSELLVLLRSARLVPPSLERAEASS
jgi:purine-binding chemotaxis protein CheW